MELYLEELERAIQSGDVTVAVESAKELARAYSRVKLTINEAKTLPEKKIRVKIVIETRHLSNVCVTLNLFPSMKFADLKQLMCEKFEFPPEVQRWIAEKRLAKDADTLYSCGIRKDDDVMYLYLLSAKSVGLTKDSHLELPVNSGQTNAPSEVKVNLANSPLLLQNTKSAEGWECPECTFVNEPTRPGCLTCSASRPAYYVVPADYRPSENERIRLEQETRIEEEAIRERDANFQQLVASESNSLLTNSDAFLCVVCLEEIAPGNGVVLHECLHAFCRECLKNHVMHAEGSVVSCPFNDGMHRCPATLQEREIKALVPDDLYQKHLARSLAEAESRIPNSFHCQTVNCTGWCVYEDDVNTFDCPVCERENCLTCKAMHEGISCKQYQDDVKVKSKNDTAAKRTQNKIEAMLKKGDAMRCPTCDIIVMKKDGCDWIRCTMCKTEICWVTKGPRWGPQGFGDINGGCRCGVNGKTCHRDCQNCH